MAFYYLELCVKFVHWKLRSLINFDPDPSCHDVRLANDHCLGAVSRKTKSKSKISVVIPVYNERSSLQKTIDSVQTGDNVEVLVCDGGSTDGTLQSCRDLEGITLIPNAGRTRAACMNRGAHSSTGEIILFLHADSYLPARWDEAIRASYQQDSEMLIGSFLFEPRSTVLAHSIALKVITRLTNVRARYFSMPYGDQALYMRKQTFYALGGYPELPFMEDYELVLRARACGGPFAIRTLPLPVSTSARRWEMHGVIINSLINQVIITGRRFGVPHSTLAQCCANAAVSSSLVDTGFNRDNELMKAAVYCKQYESGVRVVLKPVPVLNNVLCSSPQVIAVTTATASSHEAANQVDGYSRKMYNSMHGGKCTPLMKHWRCLSLVKVYFVQALLLAIRTLRIITHFWDQPVSTDVNRPSSQPVCSAETCLGLGLDVTTPVEPSAMLIHHPCYWYVGAIWMWAVNGSARWIVCRTIDTFLLAVHFARWVDTTLSAVLSLLQHTSRSNDYTVSSAATSAPAPSPVLVHVPVLAPARDGSIKNNEALAGSEPMLIQLPSPTLPPSPSALALQIPPRDFGDDPSRRWVLCKVHSVGVNPVDAKKLYGDKVPSWLHWVVEAFVEGRICGIDFSGEVVAVETQEEHRNGTASAFAATCAAPGSGSGKEEEFRPGDAVFGTIPPFTGSLAEYVLAPTDFIARKPARLSHSEAASLPLVGLTILQIFGDYGLLSGRTNWGSSDLSQPLDEKARSLPLQQGHGVQQSQQPNQQKQQKQQHLLVIGASGGTGSCAVQVAKALGVTVTGICGARNRDFVKDELGADAVLTYDSQSPSAATATVAAGLAGYRPSRSSGASNNSSSSSSGGGTSDSFSDSLSEQLAEAVRVHGSFDMVLDTVTSDDQRDAAYGYKELITGYSGHRHPHRTVRKDGQFATASTASTATAATAAAAASQPVSLLKPAGNYINIGGEFSCWVRAHLQRYFGTYLFPNSSTRSCRSGNSGYSCSSDCDKDRSGRNQRFVLHWVRFPGSQPYLQTLRVLCDAGLLKPRITAQYAFGQEQVQVAFAQIMSRRVVGKIVINLVPPPPSPQLQQQEQQQQEQEQQQQGQKHNFSRVTTDASTADLYSPAAIGSTSFTPEQACTVEIGSQLQELKITQLESSAVGGVQGDARGASHTQPAALPEDLLGKNLICSDNPYPPLQPQTPRQHHHHHYEQPSSNEPPNLIQNTSQQQHEQDKLSRQGSTQRKRHRQKRK